VFHVSMLKPYVHDSLHIVSFDTLEVNDDDALVYRPLRIVDTLTKKTPSGSYVMVKVQWSDN